MSEKHRGDTHRRARLRTPNIVDIRKRYDGGETQAKLAAEFGVTPSHISHIVRRVTWKHIP